MKKILFDVGANDGSKWLDTLSRDQETTFVYMFEPTPALQEVIKQRYEHLKNWTLVEKAVSNYRGVSKFNIAGHYDWGCSSLLEFNQDRINTWPSNRTDSHGDLHFTDSIDVEVITLADFLDNNLDITHIDYLHVDTQGSDLNVLKGMEKYIQIVNVGQIEAAYNAPLYDGSPSYIECKEWLEQNNFLADIVNMNHECDIIFTKK